MDLIKKYSLEIIVFFSGAIVMILELAGSRMLAPYVGASLSVWTSIIGVILASLSLGYAYGGRVADKNADYKTLSIILGSSGILIFLTTLLGRILLSTISSNVSNIKAESLLGSIILLGPASFFLGMVSPYAVRLKIRNVTTSGKTIGDLFAISTVGSIAGTFLAGFVLISYLGTIQILISIAVALLILSLIAFGRNVVARILLLFLILIGAGLLKWNEKTNRLGLIDVDTPYSRVWIYEETDPATHRAIRTLFKDGTHQSAMFLQKPNELVYQYTKFYRLGDHFSPGAKRALMIGGGAYSYPKDFLQSHPDATLDVVEIDPVITELARKYFKLPEDPRLTIYTEDGRTFLNQASGPYDLIFNDAFNGLTVPYQLASKEAIEHMYKVLGENGTVITNIVSGISGRRGKFLRSEYHTFKKVFPHVFIFPMYPDKPEMRQNIILVAVKSQKEPSFISTQKEIQTYLGYRLEDEVPQDEPVLTDNYAPADQMLASSP